MPTQNSYFDQFESDEQTGKSYFDQFDSDETTEQQIPQPPKDNRGMLRKTWDAATNPLIDIPVGDMIDSPNTWRSPTQARIEGFIGGAAQGLMDDAVSPLGIATAGTGSLLTKAGKAGIRGTGKVIEAGGKFLNKYNPLLSDMFEPGLIKGTRKLIGSGLEMVGNKMRGVGDVVDRYMPNQSGARTQNLERNMPINTGPKQLITNEDLADVGKDAANISTYKVIRAPEEESLSPIAKQYMSKRKMRSNNDGTFTDVNTGEVVNSKGESIIEINGKPLDRNSSFFKRNRQ